MFLTSRLFTATQQALAQGAAWTGRCVGTGASADVATIQGLECLFGNILMVITAIAGFVFFGMFVSGGFQFISSQGDQKALGSANTTLTNAFIGLIGVIGSFLIIQTIAQLTGLHQILNFEIPLSK
jgi:hypothetical protein